MLRCCPLLSSKNMRPRVMNETVRQTVVPKRAPPAYITFARVMAQHGAAFVAGSREASQMFTTAGERRLAQTL